MEILIHLSYLIKVMYLTEKFRHTMTFEKVKNFSRIVNVNNDFIKYTCKDRFVSCISISFMITWYQTR